VPARDVAATFVRWTAARAALHRGYWLVANLYLVVEADLSPVQLVSIGVAQNLTALVCEVPTGVIADTLSRKWSIVIAHLVMGAGMLATGLVTAFPALMLTQMVWGLAWTFSSGADVAWLSDELDQPDRVARVLLAAARGEQLGAAAGMIGFAALAWATALSTAIAMSGVAMWLLGLFVAARFSEQRFTPARENRWLASRSIFRSGVELARRDRQVLIILIATLLVNGAADPFERLYPRRLVELGFPQQPAPIVWFTLLALVTLTFGALALRVAEARIHRHQAPRAVYAAACAMAAVGLTLLAASPNAFSAMTGVVLNGAAWSVMRWVSVIWVNRRTPSAVRATLQSFLAQAEHLGEISFGIVLGVVAQTGGSAVTMIAACALVAAAGLCVTSRSAAGP
jgi:MFS family permease